MHLFDNYLHKKQLVQNIGQMTAPSIPPVPLPLLVRNLQDLLSPALAIRKSRASRH